MEFYTESGSQQTFCAASLEMYLDWWKSEFSAYALADISITLTFEKRDKLIATGKNIRGPASQELVRLIKPL